MRLVDTHNPFRNAVRLLCPHVGLLLEHLRDRLHIHLIIFLQRILRKCTQKLTDRLQGPVHTAQLLANIRSQLRLGLILLRRLQIYLPRLLAIGPWLLLTMKDRNEQLVDDLLAFLPARVQKFEVRRIRDVLWAGRRI